MRELNGNIGIDEVSRLYQKSTELIGEIVASDNIQIKKALMNETIKTLEIVLDNIHLFDPTDHDKIEYVKKLTSQLKEALRNLD